jgi:RHS repeat-associated protein
LYYLQSRYYNPDWGRFVNADDTDEISGTNEGILGYNMFAYCQNNPANHADPDGNCIIDIIFLAVDAGTFISHPSLKNAGWVLLDVADFADPTGIASTAEHAVKAAHAAEETLHAADEVAHTVNIVKKVGRTGKQARLRQIANDTKVSRSLRGEIKRDINMIKNGKRKTIRVPNGYEMAHRRGFEARKGFGYSHSDLQVIKNHRTQHRIDNYGRGR